jgi:hypothetical protein
MAQALRVWIKNATRTQHDGQAYKTGQMERAAPIGTIGKTYPPDYHQVILGEKSWWLSHQERWMGAVIGTKKMSVR